ncbi:MAG: RNA polymerase sigma factor [Bacteroidales bacterium]|nr:RNA polymerase sigma factor [Bacteroidales bacterium]
MLSRLDEIALIARCVATDDRRAFGRLVEEHQESLRRFLFNLTMGDEALADDLAQETFIKAYTGLRQFKGISKFRTWLYRIAYNEYYSYIRQARPEEAWDESRPPTESAEMPHETADLRHDLNAAMRCLSELERSLILLFYLEDLPIKKVAAITGLNDSTTRVYLLRAKEKMRQHLSSEPFFE